MMGDKIASLYAEIGGDTSPLTRALTTAKQNLAELGKQSNRVSRGMADDFTRAGIDFRQVGGSVDDYIGRLKASTPEMLGFGRRYATITQQFEAGEITGRDATKQLEALKNEMREAAQPADELKGKYKGLSGTINDLKGQILPAAAVVAGFGVALKKAWDMAKEAANMDYTIQKFDRLAVSVGTTSDALLNDLQKATKGTRSEMDLMASAGDLMALGLAKSKDEVIRLSTVAGQLGMDMNQLVLTLTNQTTMRFDALGVSVDGFDEKVEALKKTGMSASDAFKEAFLQQAEEQVVKLGNKADTTAGKFAQFEVKVQDLGNAFKMDLLPHADAVITALDIMFFGKDKIVATLAAHEEEVRKTAKSYGEYTTELHRATKAAGYHIDAAGQLRDGANRVTEGFLAVTESAWDTGTNLDYVDRMAQNAKGSVEDLGEASAETALEMSAITGAVSGDMKQAFDEYNDNIGDLRLQHVYLNAELDRTIEKTPWLKQKIEDLTGAIFDNKQKQYDLYLQLKDTTKEIMFQELSAGLTGQALWDFALATGNLTEEAYIALIASQDLRAEFDKGLISAKDMGVGVNDLAAAIAYLQSKDITITVTTIERTIREMYTGGGIGTPERTGDQSDFVTPTTTKTTTTTTTTPTVKPQTYEELKAERGYATGGSFFIPSGFTESWPVGPNHVASSGEQVDITPVGKTPKGGITITIENANFANPVDMETTVYRMAQEALRRMS